MQIESRFATSRLVAVAVIAGLILVLSSGLLYAQGDAPAEELTLDELQEQRELLAAEASAIASSIDVSSASVEEIREALDDMAELSDLHQIRLDEATSRYRSAVEQFDRATDEHEEATTAIAELKVFIGELAVATFTGEATSDELVVALSDDPGEAARFLHLLELQTGDVANSIDQLRRIQVRAEELIIERNEASRRAGEELGEIDSRTGELAGAIQQQQALLEQTQSRLEFERLSADALAGQTIGLELLLAQEEERLENAIQGIGTPAAVNQEDIVTLTFFEADGTTPVFRIQVHKDIEEQTRGLYELAFSQGINLGGWGYRDTARQIELREAHCGSSDYEIWLRPASQCSPPTARPGFSKHEQGRAIDFQWNGGSIGPRSGAPFQWLAANAPQFGFVNLPSEPWHWSDGSGISFDPTVPVPDIPEDAFLEAEPEGDAAELLNGLVELEGVPEEGVSEDCVAEAAVAAQDGPEGGSATPALAESAVADDAPDPVDPTADDLAVLNTDCDDPTAGDADSGDADTGEAVDPEVAVSESDASQDGATDAVNDGAAGDEATEEAAEEVTPAAAEVSAEEPAPAPQPEEVPGPQPEPAPQPEEVPEPQPEPAPQPEAEPQPEAAPEPELEPEPAPEPQPEPVPAATKPADATVEAVPAEEPAVDEATS